LILFVLGATVQILTIYGFAMSLFSSKPPPAPDYQALAREQGQVNIDAARLSGRLNNPTIYNPYGSREVTYGGNVDPNKFNAGAYDEAMRKYKSDYEAWRLDPSGRPRAIGADNMPIAPDRSQFMGGFDPDAVTVVERLTPEAQKLFDQEMRINQQFGNVAEGGLGRVSRAMGSDFDASMLPVIGNIDYSVFNPTGNFSPRSDLPKLGDIDYSVFEPTGSFQARSDLPSLQADELTRDRIEQALIQRLQPQLDRQRELEQEQLLMRGQGMGGRAWQNTQQDLATRESEALLSAILGAGQEQSRLFDMASQARGQLFGEDANSYQLNQGNQQANRLAQQSLFDMQSQKRNQLFGEDLSAYQTNLNATQLNRGAQQAMYGLQEANRNRALQEALTLRQLPLNEINALRTGNQVVVPQFQGYQGQAVQPMDVMGAGQAQYQAAVNNANAKSARNQAMLSGLVSLGSAGLGAAGAAGGFGNLFGAGASAGSGASYFGGLRL